VRIPRTFIALPVTLILGLTLGGPAAADPVGPTNPPGSTASPTGQESRADRAKEALADVQALLDGRGDARSHADRRGLTLALRDLIALRNALPASQQDDVARILARPARDATSCSAVICVHYKISGADAPPLDDLDVDGVPDYVEQVRDTTQQVHSDFVNAGYRRPKGDGTRGGNGENKVDIYLEDLNGVYGYCTTDEGGSSRTRWAYCGLDNDYAGFPNTPIENIRVTAAHEYFHAIQYAYDAFEDGWILESTATWVEDELFDAVNDNRAYLGTSPMTFPFVPIDTFDPDSGFHYGTWIWWRYLTEKFKAKTGKLPKLVLDVWNRLDARGSSAPDDYSTQGLARVLGKRKTSLRNELQKFFAANRHPRTVYEEGNAYPAAPTDLKLGYGGATRKGAFSKLFHMAASTVRLNPNNLSQRDWRLKLSFNAQNKAQGGAFVVIVYKKGGGLSTSLIRLNRKGNGAKTVPFSSRNIDHVDVIFVNASSRFNCFQSATSPYSCLGFGKDDGRRSEFFGKAFRA
jgi:hypothetical protein